MATLLALPLEIRSIIIDYVLCWVNPALPNPEDVKSLPRREADDIRYYSWTRGENIKYETQPERYQSNCHGLLLANHLLRFETIERLRMGLVPNYSLDVMLVNDTELWPTWTYLPVKMSNIQTLTITIRIFGTCTNDKHMLGERTRGAPPNLGWVLLSLLERIIVVGPSAPAQLEQTGETTRTAISSIQQLRLEVEMLPRITQETPVWSWPPVAFQQKVRKLASRPLGDLIPRKKPNIQPYELWTCIKRYILSWFVNEDIRQDLKLLLEHIGMITLILDCERIEWELWEVVKHTRRSDRHPCSWWDAILAERKSRGLACDRAT